MPPAHWLGLVLPPWSHGCLSGGRLWTPGSTPCTATSGQSLAGVWLVFRCSQFARGLAPWEKEGWPFQHGLPGGPWPCGSCYTLPPAALLLPSGFLCAHCFLCLAQPHGDLWSVDWPGSFFCVFGVLLGSVSWRTVLGNRRWSHREQEGLVQTQRRGLLKVRGLHEPPHTCFC